MERSMTDLLFPAPDICTLPVRGQTALYPVHRIFCVGRNYAGHAREMGNEVDRDAPFYFTKSLSAFCPTGQSVPYPPGTANFHHEMELVVAIGAPVFRATPKQAQAAVFGYACGLDMTRRDLQAAAKAGQKPWDTAKDVERSAVIAGLTPAAAFGAVGAQRIALTLNGGVRQNAQLADMVWSVVDVICHLSTLYHLAPGDVILTGTPAGVGPVVPGDVLAGEIDGLDPVTLTITPPEV